MPKPKIAKYKVGYRAEIRARKLLESWGFTVVRAAASKGPFDLLAFDQTKMMLVQVKVCPHGKIPLYNTIRKELAVVPAPANCRKELWVWERRGGFHHFPI